MRRFRVRGACTLFFFSALGMGCTGGAAPVSAPAPVVAPGPLGNSLLPPRPAAHPADVQFLSGMIHHHAQALVMAEWALSHGSSQQVRTLAERILVSQVDEIRLMQQWLEEMGQPVPEPNPAGMRMVMGGMEHDMLMPGMLSPEQLSQLEGARGGAFDRLFLTLMIQHHEGAMVMVEELLATHGGAVDDFVYKMASDTFADQGSEIDRMWRMLEAMGPSGP